MASIRLFLTLTLISIIVLVTFLSSLRGYQESMIEAERLFDLQLLEHVKLLSLAKPAVTATSANEVFEELMLPDQGDLNLSAEMVIAYQIFSENGRLLSRSVIAPFTAMGPFEVGYRDVNFNGYRWRLLVIRDLEEQQWLMAAQRYDVRYELAESVILQSVTPTVLSIPIAAILIWFIVGYGLRPISLLAKEVRSREASDLSRVQLDGVPRELTPLTQSTNDLLRRLQSSFSREKRFAADAAHELRTPISTLKVQVHNLLAELDRPSATAEELRQGVDAMGHLVEQILVLNRTAPDQYMVQFLPVDLYELVKDVVSAEFEQVLQREQVFELDGSTAVVSGDATALRSLVQNLLSNASKYTPVGGAIRMNVREVDQQVQLVVEDSGPGIPQSHHERVFDRFYRLDGDRNASGVSGSGLGLAIVKHIVEMHGGDITLSASEALGGLCVTIMFNASANDSASQHNNKVIA
ncbi:MAG: ATP-binding protein [Gammaproteobacteria bacterium]|nr:ATP-binding protein [Gammaproteobacteria bacterium]MDP2140595.1 ATP-binding protein [Gammaproteobacteria bacterium]MDP2347367.1 ATP-binding protein [Gammaproteobacteria bacterium]